MNVSEFLWFLCWELLLTAVIALGCGAAAPASQSTDSAPAPQTSASVTTVKTTDSAPTSQPSTSITTVKTTDSAPVSEPTASVAVTKVEPQADIVEIGYEVGMRAPEFGMSLLDGTKVTSSDLANEGKPVFLYFHATF